ncbi:MAG TPA: hypothetical protein VGR03_07435 [Candidatus Acidoferrum sp.]|nr:hypothetical protein [Candidatus Acidoferrum sp.]
MTDSGAVPAKGTPQQKDKQVTITVAANQKDVIVAPDPVRLNKFAKHTATWVCTQGLPFEVEFEETPFQGSTFNHDTAKNLIPRDDVINNAQHTYKYSVSVAGITKDPGLIVDP